MDALDEEPPNLMAGNHTLKVKSRPRAPPQKKEKEREEEIGGD
jgi:hypothetical protein